MLESRAFIHEIFKNIAIGRRSLGVQNPKLHEIVHTDLFDYAPIESELRGFDACFFVSAFFVGDETGGLRTHYVRIDSCGRRNSVPTEPTNDIHVCVRCRHRQFREGSGGMGSRQGTDEE